ncbi:Transcription factor myb3r-5 [Entomophthora muscae]|uniref:Transcription factor myb3r-5 n=1 Tax=Entomophthora muscae TaxID=34485 RepID=A0ACC2SFW9_9FUNG|nr:Transcription factor myb3r-5 [Entomophthora muscae]
MYRSGSFYSTISNSFQSPICFGKYYLSTFQNMNAYLRFPEGLRCSPPAGNSLSLLDTNRKVHISTCSSLMLLQGDHSTEAKNNAKPEIKTFSRVPDSLAKLQTKWTPEMDKKLLEAAKKKGSKIWKMVAAETFPEFNTKQVYQRYLTISHDWAKGKWSEKELSLLKQVATIYSPDWVAISNHVVTRSPLQCLNKWGSLIDPEVGRTPWTVVESDKLLRLVLKSPGLIVKDKSPCYADVDWTIISRYFLNKTRALCRSHFFNNLCDKALDKLHLPPYDKGPWTPQQSAKLISLVQEYSTNWTLISFKLRTRSPSQCMFHWNALKKKKIQIMNGVPKSVTKSIKWTPAEDEALLRMYRLLGKQWTLIINSEPTLASRDRKKAQVRFITLIRKIQKPWFTLLPRST